MVEQINSVNNKNLSILATESTQVNYEGGNQRRLGEDLLKESSKHLTDSRAQAEKAREYLNAADVLERAAKAVRAQAQRIKEGSVKKEDAVKEVAQVFGSMVQMPLPKNASPEELERIAEDLEAKAKENRLIADELLKDSESKEALSNRLREQAVMVAKKESGIDAMRMRSVTAHTEGLSMVFKKLGIYNLDMQYKELIAYASKKSMERGQ